VHYAVVLEDSNIMLDTLMSCHTSENTPISHILDGNQPAPHHFTGRGSFMQHMKL